ncbi:MAG: hypothetical protein V3U13_06230 [Gemmatimonadota bacterium]
MVFNEGKGSWTRSGVSPRLRELWRVGGLADDEALAGPQMPVVSTGGWVAIPDAVLSEVIIVTPSGEWRGSVLREGEGPGEVRWPVAAGWTAEHILLVLDLSVAKVVEFDLSADRTVLEWRIPQEVFAKIALSGSLPGILLTSSGTVVLEMPWRPVEGGSPVDRYAALLEVGPSHAAPETLLVTRTKVLGGERFTDWPLPGAPRPLMAAGASGSMAIAGQDARYRVRLLGSARKDSLVICRDAAPFPLSPGETGEAEPAGTQFSKEVKAAPRPDSLMPFGRMFLGAGGRLWVQRERSIAHGYEASVRGGTYDVFEAGGEYLGVIHAGDGVLIVGEAHGLVFGDEKGEFDEVSLVAYRLELVSESEERSR